MMSYFSDVCSCIIEINGMGMSFKDIIAWRSFDIWQIWNLWNLEVWSNVIERYENHLNNW